MLGTQLLLSIEAIKEISLGITATQLNLNVAFIYLLPKLVTADIKKFFNNWFFAGAYCVTDYKSFMSE